MFTNMTLFILFEMFLNPISKMTIILANVARTTASTISWARKISIQYSLQFFVTVSFLWWF